MRTSPLRERLAASGAALHERGGVEVVSHLADRRSEYSAIREAVGLTDFSFVRVLCVPEEKGIDFLDALLAGNVPKIRFGRVLHTFLADTGGLLAGDCYVANNDKEFVFLCESIISDSEFDALMQASGASEAGAQDLAPSHALLSLDGCKAWEVVKQLFGPDVLGLPYLSIENYSFGGEPVRLLRAGKTSEFGYLLLAPASVAGALFDTLKAAAQERGGRLCGVDVHDDLRLEGRFFNVQREGRRVRDPLVLGLQWMIDFDKEDFRGGAAIKQRRAAGLRQKIIGVAAEPGGELLPEGAALFLGDQPVAQVVTSCFSYILNQPLGLALFPIQVAYSGLALRLGSPNGPAVRSISLPPILPKSLTIKLDEM